MCLPDAQLSWAHVSWSGFGPRLQHQPDYTEEMAGKESSWTAQCTGGNSRKP